MAQEVSAPMQANRNGGPAQRPQDHAQDIRDQAVVLTFVLTVHPQHLTIPQLARSLNEDRRRIAGIPAPEGCPASSP